jgi:hypothetical protein
LQKKEEIEKMMLELNLNKEEIGADGNLVDEEIGMDGGQEGWT